MCLQKQIVVVSNIACLYVMTPKLVQGLFILYLIYPSLRKDPILQEKETEA